jgi:molecular chaperone GrpE
MGHPELEQLPRGGALSDDRAAPPPETTVVSPAEDTPVSESAEANGAVLEDAEAAAVPVPEGEVVPAAPSPEACPQPEVAGGEPVQSLVQRACLAEDRLAEVLAAYRALKAETEAHRERVTRNAERRFEQRHERLLLKFIDILDNLDRALDAVEHTAAGAALIDGLILVRTQLLQTLQAEGLERIPARGLPFDPALSEAVTVEAVDDPDRHYVVLRELMRGYRLHNRVARPSRVVVGRYEPPPASEATAETVAEEASPPAAGEPPPDLLAASPADAPEPDDGGGPTGPDDGSGPTEES